MLPLLLLLLLVLLLLLWRVGTVFGPVVSMQSVLSTAVLEKQLILAEAAHAHQQGRQAEPCCPTHPPSTCSSRSQQVMPLPLPGLTSNI